ncbi:PTS sugar transporter subunit IIA [Lagierella sp.]|uniref:PTS sugar transporter subunit IIA n=1 Tax=Lagierella sp. TaxID=2849657 RepID=UPI00262089AA|nr:PTS sugar transporter subunit IIA [Lagierella sp.]
MNGVIVTAHGRFPEGLEDGLKLIAGEQENLVAVNFLQEDGTDGLDDKIKKALEDLKDCDSIVILTDLAGGTPFNRSVLLTAQMENVRVLAGANFQMLYTAVFDGSKDLDKLVENILAEGKNGVRVYREEKRTEDEDSDGI